jgi:hypothetical protein
MQAPLHAAIGEASRFFCFPVEKVILKRDSLM